MVSKLYHSNRQLYKLIIGVDEVGVGPLAGPVTATAVTCAVTLPLSPLSYIKRGGTQRKALRDSKHLTPKQREEFFKIFKKNSALNWAIASVMPKTIDRMNIFEARRLAAKRAVLKLEKKMGQRADMLLLDGKSILRIARRQEAIIKGDEKVPLIAVASIIAKVTRDRAMARYHKKYPEYGFDSHKGYGTKRHYGMLAKYGPSMIHRKSFRLK